MVHSNMGNTINKTEKCFPPNLNALVTISKAMRAAKLCCYKILQFVSTGGAG